MRDSDHRSIDARPWLAPDAQAGSYALGLLGLEERKLLYELARHVYSGAGEVVELGAFCGASTCCLAAGLSANPKAAGRKVHSYDRFVADEPYLVEFIRTQFGDSIEMGQSFADIFRRATVDFAGRIEVHAGDLLEQSWPGGAPIELLFVDIAKTLALSGKVLTGFFPHLTPGRSIVIQQDFYHPTAFYLPVVMDFLADHFTIIEAGRDWSVVFRLETPIPQNKLKVASLYQFTFVQQQAALRRMARRVGPPGRDYLRLSECAAIGTCFGERRFQTALDHAIRRSEIQSGPVWGDGLAWCADFRASRIRTRLYGSPSLMPSPSAADRACLTLSAIRSAIAARIAPCLKTPTKA